MSIEKSSYIPLRYVICSIPILRSCSSLSGDYCHMAYNVITAFCLMTLLRRSLRPVPAFIQVCIVQTLMDNVVKIMVFCMQSKPRNPISRL